jgi:hypothetical protein
MTYPSGGAVTGTYALTGRLTVDLPPGEAFRLFTPRGERDWVPGWEPRFPVPTDDDSAPGTVFQTDAHGATTTWVVVDREADRHIRYARCTPGVSAGTVAVTLEAAGGSSRIVVTYVLTALDPVARHQLDAFADGFDEFLGGWQQAIAGIAQPPAA